MWWWTAVALAGGRLPDGVRPLAHELHITLDPATGHTSGESVIRIVVTEPTERLRIHAEKLQFRKRDVPTLTREDGQAWPLAVETGDGVVVDLDYGEVIRPGTYVLRVPFDGAMPDQSYGFYRFASEGAWYGASQLQADEARTAFPCFDEPGFKIPFTVVATVPAGLEVISNEPALSRTPSPEGDVVRFATTPPMPSYALALLVGPYEATPIPGLSSIVWSVHGRADHAEALVVEVPRMLGELEAWFGTPMPYTKLDLVTIPEFPYGAMENPGAIVVGENSTSPLADRTPQDAEWTAQVAAHELAHLWFGDLVTLQWWDDFWLNEAFAEWLSRKIVRHVHPEFGGEVERVESLAYRLESDGRSSARPLKTEVDPDAVFDTVNFAVFPKGRAILDMVETWIGAETLQDGLRVYLDRYAWGNATSDDLFAVLEEVSGQDVRSVVTPFVDLPGAPFLTFERGEGGRWWVRQVPYAVRGNDPPSPGPWDVPVRLRFGRADGSVGTLEVRVGAEPQPLDLADAVWVHPAADGIGYYVWSLGDADLRRLVGALPQLTAPERMSILTALGLQLSAGHRSLDEVLATLHAFETETDPRIVQKVVDLVGRVDVAELLGDPALETQADAFVRSRLRPLLDALGPRPEGPEAGRTLTLRLALLAMLADAGDPEARDAGFAAAERVFADPTSEDPAWAEVGLAIYARYGGPEAGARLRAAALAEQDPRPKERLLLAYGQVAGREGLEAAFAHAADPDVPASEELAVLGGIQSRHTEAERDLAFALARRHDAALRAKLPPITRGRLVYFGGGCSEARVREAAAFYSAPGRTVPGIDHILGGLRAGVAECLAQVEADGPAIRALLGDTGL